MHKDPTKIAMLAMMAVLGVPAMAQTAPSSEAPAANTSEDVIITGQRGALNRARAAERNAASVVNVITADTVGQFPDQNVAESVRRVPGVNVVNDEGEGRNISVRGLPSAFTNVTVNGARIGSVDDASAQVQLDSVGSELLESITIIKAATPDIDGDAIGGSVELKTLSAFQRGENSFAIGAEVYTSDLRGDHSLGGSFNFTRLLFNNTLGIAGSLTYSDRHTLGDDLRNEAGLTPFRTVLTGNQGLRPDEIDHRVEQGDRERYGANLNFEYRPTDLDELFVRLQFTSLYDWDRRYQAEYETDQANTLQELTRGPVGPGFALFGFNGTATTATGGPDIDRQFALATFLDRVYVGSIGSEHERGPWDFSWQADYSLARATSDGQYRGRYRIRNVSLDATFGETGYTLRALPVGTRDPSNPANFLFDNLRRVDLNREDTIAAIQGELRRNFEFAGREAFFEAGVKMRNRDAVTGQDVFSFNPQSSAFNAVPNIAVLRGNLSTLAGFDVPSTIAPLGVFPTADAARGRFDAAFQAIGRLVTPALGETFGGDFTLDESTTAYYAMAQFEPLPDFSVLTGLRLEQTDLSTQGYFTQLDNDDNPIPAPGIGLVNLGNRGSDYAVVMPHLHVTWRPTDQIDVRASFNRGLQRPDFDDFANRQSYNFVTRDLSAGNPFLDPLIADNFDVQLGWYPNRNTAFQVGFYYKSIQDFFVEYDGPFRNTAGALVTPITPATGIASEPLSIEVVLNGDSATVTGVELNYSQNLTMLPGPLSGLFIASNLTFIDSEAQLTSVRPNETFTLPGQPDILANLSLGYENDWTTVRLAGNYVGESLEEVSGIETLTDANGTTTFQFGRERDVFRNERFSLDLTAQLKFGENVRMTFEASNLTESSDEKVYRGNAATGPIFQQIESFGRTFTFGVNTRF